MAKKIHLEAHDTLNEWHDKIRRIRKNEHKLKMLVIEKILANCNISAKEVQEIFFIYNESGVEGLTATNSNGRGSGRGNKKVEDDVFISLKKAIEENPNKKWTGKEKEAYIKEQFDIEISQQAIAYRMKNI